VLYPALARPVTATSAFERRNLGSGCPNGWSIRLAAWWLVTFCWARRRPTIPWTGGSLSKPARAWRSRRLGIGFGDREAPGKSASAAKWRASSGVIRHGAAASIPF